MVRLALTVLAVALLGGCGGGASAPEGAAPGETAGSSAPAASVEGETLDGGRLSLADLRGTPVFVNVWASW